jgi:phosphomannomutase
MVKTRLSGATSRSFSDSPPIRFGTDGWRARIAEEFTTAGVRRCAAGIAAHLHEIGRESSPVVIGYDGRFLSGRFAREVALYLAAERFVPVLSPSPIPTPALSWRTLTAGASLGIMITASHNPPEYNGLKLKSSDGGTLDPEETERIAHLIPSTDPGRSEEEDLATHPSFLPSYLKALKERVRLKEIRGSRMKLVHDAMHGMGGNLLEQVLSGGAARVLALRAVPDPLFGGANPEPMARNMSSLFQEVRKQRASAGFATDGDADRMAACDERGRFLSPLTLLPVLAQHFIEVRGERGGIAKTFAGSLRMERIANRHGLPFHDLPVGFKHVASLLRRKEILLGGEESGGFGFHGFLPERDGILSSLFLLEAMVLADQPLSALVARMEKAYGRFAYDRVDVRSLPAEGMRRTLAFSAAPPGQIAGMRVTGVNRLDGVKLLFGEDGWVLFRQSGTEPVLRLYCEAPNQTIVSAVLRQAVRLIQR